MKAIVYDRYGPPEVLRLEEIERPRPGDDDVVIRVRAAPATRADCQMRAAEPFVARFALGLLRPRRRPAMPGAELSGEVSEVGRSVSRIRVGDRVWASTGEGLGAMAEYARVPEGGALGRMPRGGRARRVLAPRGVYLSTALERARDAYRYVETGHKRGNVIITMGEDA